MLSIGAMNNGQEAYYQRLAREDYYLEGGEPPGKWLGKGAGVLGLRGVVEAKELSLAFRGYSRRAQALVQNAGKANRQPGWDLTFSAPKSVSVLWSQAEAYERREIQAAQAAAVEATISFLENECAVSRVGKGGADQVHVGLAVAVFEHSCSRALDPQLHTHCLVMNLGVDGEGSVRSILSQPFYVAKMLAGAFYRCELARQLQQRLGVEIERPTNAQGRLLSWFEVRGVSKSILCHFSKRRAAIEAELGRRGMESASAAAFATLTTRESKTIVPPRSELVAGWKQEGERLGFFLPSIFHARQTHSAEQLDARFETALQQAVDVLTWGENYFSRAELGRETLIACQGLGLGALAVTETVDDRLFNDPRFVSLGLRNGQALWTTQEILHLEQQFLSAAAALKERTFVPVLEKYVAESLAAPRGKPDQQFWLDGEQQAALRYITQGTESIKVISGFAGTGKTDLLAAASEALEKGGYHVIGTALAGVAARGLQAKTGIPTATVRMRELQLFPTLERTFKHHVRQLFRAAMGQSTFRLAPLAINERTVLVIDEAGMIGTRDFTLLVKAIVERGGSIVAVGDDKQLSSIERGGCFSQLIKEIGGVHLSEIRRQSDEVDRKAVKDVVLGNAEVALQHYAEKGQVFVGVDREEAEAGLIADWVKQGGVTNPSRHRIFAGTRAEVARFNSLAQWERVRAGLIDPTCRVEHQGAVFMVGDRVRFNANEHRRGIVKGEGGTVVACQDGFSGKYVAVRLDGDTLTIPAYAVKAAKHHARQLINAALGKRTATLRPRKDIVLVPLQSFNPLKKSYDGLSLDYAMTVHLGQGQTVNNSYVLLGGRMTDRELSYVQMSRHRDGLYLYTGQLEAGKDLSALARKTRPEHSDRKISPQEIPDYSLLVRQMKLSRVKEFASSSEHQHSALTTRLIPLRPQGLATTSMRNGETIFRPHQH